MAKKKTSFSSLIPSWFSRGVFQGLVVALVAGGALAVYAAVIDWPEEPYTPTGLQSVFVRVSTAKYDAVLGNGYVDATAKCNAVVTGSHVCTSDELIHSYNTNVAAVTAATGQAWLNNGPPGYPDKLSNDCSGWKDVAATTYGSFWNFDTDASYVDNCAVPTRPFACCK